MPQRGGPTIVFGAFRAWEEVRSFMATTLPHVLSSDQLVNSQQYSQVCRDSVAPTTGNSLCDKSVPTAQTAAAIVLKLVVASVPMHSVSQVLTVRSSTVSCCSPAAPACSLPAATAHFLSELQSTDLFGAVQQCLMGGSDILETNIASSDRPQVAALQMEELLTNRREKEALQAAAVVAGQPQTHQAQTDQPKMHVGNPMARYPQTDKFHTDTLLSSGSKVSPGPHPASKDTDPCSASSHPAGCAGTNLVQTASAAAAASPSSLSAAAGASPSDAASPSAAAAASPSSLSAAAGASPSDAASPSSPSCCHQQARQAVIADTAHFPEQPGDKVDHGSAQDPVMLAAAMQASPAAVHSMTASSPHTYQHAHIAEAICMFLLLVPRDLWGQVRDAQVHSCFEG